MTFTSQGVNGCSLEDCHTNIFSLTDLNEIQWYTYRPSLTAPSSDFDAPLEDPVLLSYTKCLSADILAVWKRIKKPTHSQPPINPQSSESSSSYGKELWVFWYKTEPANLHQNLVSKALERVDNGSWKDGQLTYECRTLLFKALHNLIEKCLLSQNFVRIGKWFVQPVNSIADRSGHLSFAFNFFLHGESTVCASIDVRQHHPLLVLAPYHLVQNTGGVKRKEDRSSKTRNQENPPPPAAKGVEVLLSPYGLRGHLTNRTLKDTDPSVAQCLEEWRHFYPVRIPEDSHIADVVVGGLSATTGAAPANNGLNKVPAVVEVVVGGDSSSGGVRMKYPSCHVLVASKSENPLDCVGGAIPRVVSVQRASTPAAASIATSGSRMAPPTPEPNLAATPANTNAAVGAVGKAVSSLQQQHSVNQSYALTPPTSPADQLNTNRLNAAAAKAAHAPVEEFQGPPPTISDFLSEATIRGIPTADSLAHRLLHHVEKDRSIFTAADASSSPNATTSTTTTASSSSNTPPPTADVKLKTEFPTTVKMEKLSPGGTSAVFTSTTSSSSSSTSSPWLFHDATERQSCHCPTSIRSRANSSGAGSSNFGGGGKGGSSSRMGGGSSSGGGSTGNSSNPLNIWGESIRKHLGGDLEFPGSSKSKEKQNAFKPKKFGGSFHRRFLPALTTTTTRFIPDPFSPAYADNFTTFRTPGAKTTSTTSSGGHFGGALHFNAASGHSRHSLPSFDGGALCVKAEMPLENGIGGAEASPFSATPSPLISNNDPMMQPLTINAGNGPTTNGPSLGGGPPSHPGFAGGIAGCGLQSSGLGSSGQPVPDPTMPTLSPHPPLLKKEADIVSSANASHALCSSSLTVNTRSSYVGPLGPSCTSSTSTSSPSASGALKSSFFEDVAKRAQSLAKSLKRRPHLNPTIREGEGVSGLDSPTFRNLYDDEENGGKMKRIKVEESSVKTEPAWDASASSGDPSAPVGVKPGVKSGCPSDPNRRSSSPDPYEFPDDDDDNRDPGFGGEDDGFGPEETPNTTAEGKADEEASPETNDANLHKGGAAQYNIETQLVASYKDLDNLFDTDSETEDDNGNSKSTKASKGGAGNGGGGGSSGECPSSELANIYPTPPSADHNKDDTDPEVTGDHPMDTMHAMNGFPPSLSLAKHDPLFPPLPPPGFSSRPLGYDEALDWSRQWKQIWKPPPMAHIKGSAKYAPVKDLPSSKLPPIEITVAYKRTSGSSYSILPVDTKPLLGLADENAYPSRNLSQLHGGALDSSVHSPASFGGPPRSLDSQQQQLHSRTLPHPPLSHPGASFSDGCGVGHPRTPLSHNYEPLASPLSNASSAYQVGPKAAAAAAAQAAAVGNMADQRVAGSDSATGAPHPPNHASTTQSPSVSAHPHLQQQQQQQSQPEANSLVVNIVLSDTLLNLFKDHNFDSCNICVCNTDLKGLDVEVTLPDPSGDSQYRCTCGFSAVRNRYLGYNAGLFWEDERQLLALGGGKFSRSSSNYLHKAALTETPDSSSASSPSATRNGINNNHSRGPTPTPTTSTASSTAASASSTTIPPSSSSSSSLSLTGFGELPMSVLELLFNQFTVPFASPTLLGLYSDIRLWSTQSRKAIEAAVDLELSDGCNVSSEAMQIGCHSTDRQRRFDFAATTASSFSSSSSSFSSESSVIHRWAFDFGVNQSKVNSADVVRLLRSLQPFLQDAIQSKRHTNLWDVVYNVTGPLTWNEFHKMAGRGTDEQCEPQPIPAVLVGYGLNNDPQAPDKDWLSLSPFAIGSWEKLMLEPYTQARDVSYVVVAPENDLVLSRVKTFFSDLTTTYETCRLGQHRPLTDKLRDGIMRVSKKMIETQTTTSSSIRTKTMTSSASTTTTPCSEENQQNSSPSSSPSLNKWFELIGDSDLASKIRLYAQICVQLLAPFLVKTLQSCDEAERLKFEMGASPCPPPVSPRDGQPENQHPANIPGSMQPPPPPDGIYIKKEESDASSSSLASSLHSHSDGIQKGGIPPATNCVSTYRTHPTKYEFETEPPSIVVYIVDPFTYQRDRNADTQRLATIGLLRCFTDMMESMETQLPSSLRNRFHLELVPLATITNNAKDQHNTLHLGRLKTLAFSVFSQCRRVMEYKPPYKSLTGLGPCAEDEALLKETKSSSLPPLIPRLFAPPFILDSPKNRPAFVNDILGGGGAAGGGSGGAIDKSSATNGKANGSDKAATLFCGYCLSEDQRMLIAAFTDERGELLQTRTINVEIPDRSRRRKASARKIGLQKLFDACLSVMAASTHSWRLVVGRFGRLGHGELKGWNALLAKKSLSNACNQLKEACPTCVPFAGQACRSDVEHPSILSACLVSLVADTSLTVMTDAVCSYGTNETRRVEETLGRMHTPKDASQTHILVFPTSATAHANQPGKTDTDNDNIDMDFLGGDGVPGIGEDPMFDDLFGSDDLFGGVGDLDKSTIQQPNSPQSNSRSGPGNGPGGLGSTSGFCGSSSHAGTSPPEEHPPLQNQPLALGYYVSSAKTWPLPYWFWSKAPKYENACPSFFKAALHIHVPSAQTRDANDGDRDAADLIHVPTSNNSRDPNQKPNHPLDSTTTCDVLRHVLERYNALSWLTFDPATGDRRSCLPVHLLVLLQLSEAVSTFL